MPTTDESTGSWIPVFPYQNLKPRPALTYSSVPLKGPMTAPPLGLTRAAFTVPLFSGSLESTLK